MSSKEVIKLAKRHGWVVKSQKGSHIKVIHPDKEKPVIIPYHGAKNIPIGTLHTILKSLEIK